MPGNRADDDLNAPIFTIDKCTRALRRLDAARAATP
jgi:hypothetical protein